MNLTAEQIKAALAAANVAINKQDQIVADLLTLQGTPPEDPPLSQDEIRAILHFMGGRGIERWSSWPTREEQARKQLSGLMAAYDAKIAADQALANELSNLDKILS